MAPAETITRESVVDLLRTLHLPTANTSFESYITLLAGILVLMNLIPYRLAANSTDLSADTASEG